MIRMTVSQNLKQLTMMGKKIPQKRQRYVRDKANEIVSYIHTYLITKYYPPASGWLEPPAIRTGKLLKSIRRSTTSVDRYITSSSVEATERYAVYLEYGTRSMVARPFLRPALFAVMSRSDHAKTLSAYIFGADDVFEDIGRLSTRMSLSGKLFFPEKSSRFYQKIITRLGK